jgi:hypothetical protein
MKCKTVLYARIGSAAGWNAAFYVLKLSICDDIAIKIMT